MNRLNQFLGRSQSLVTSGKTYLNIVSLLLTFPLGIVSFVVVVTLLSIPSAFLAAPFIYSFSGLSLWIWQIDTFGESLILFVLGIPIGLISLYVINLCASGLKSVLGVVVRS